MARTPDRARNLIATRRSKRLEAKRGGRMERGETSVGGERQGVNRRKNNQNGEDDFREDLIHTSDMDTTAEEEMTHEELEENIDEEHVTLEKLKETLLLERERDKDLAEQHAQLMRQNAMLALQNRQLNEEAAADAMNSEGNTISSGEEETRQRKYACEDDGGERRRRQRRESSEKKDLRWVLEETRWEDQRRRYAEERRNEIERRREEERILPRTLHVVEDDPKYEKGEPSTAVPSKLVAVSSGDQEWIDQQRYKESIRRNYEPRSHSTGYRQRSNQGPSFGEKRPNAPDFEDVKLPRLNTTVKKIWEAIALTEEIPPPPNLGREPPSTKSIQNFHDNILKRVHKRDFRGNKIFNVAKKEPLEEWKNRDITFSTKNAPEGGALHTEPLWIKGVASTYHQTIRFPMPSAIGEIKGYLKNERDFIEKDVHKYDEKLRRKIEQKRKVCEEKIAEQLMVFTIGISEEQITMQKSMEEADKMTMEKTTEKESQVEMKQSGKTKKGKIAEGREVVRSEKETPIAKEKRTPQGRSKANNSKRKKVSIQEIWKGVELSGHFGKKNEACVEDKEMEKLKEELYQERRRKEDLVKERIRLERQNEKLLIKNNHLKRKQTEHNTQRGENASGKKLETEGRQEYCRDRKWRGEQNEREDLKRSIKSSMRELREK
ncbi:trichohyalin-like [Papaver somniferum]|uniref:trichohyalin-like n=1 Tax=Papaver somniferum TaxID=3469 RepID=UPI000E6F9878|nr:trichohyalin-like [Papaver somniferum]